MKFVILITTLALTLIAFNIANAQFISPSWGFGVAAGGARGDNAGESEVWVPQIRGFVQKGLTQDLAIQIGLAYTELEATDRYGTQTLMGDFRFLLKPMKMQQMFPYFYAGIGATKDMEFSSSDWLPIVPAGLGLQTKLGDQLMFDINAGYNLSLSDKFVTPSGSNAVNSFTGKKNGGFFDIMVGLVYTSVVANPQRERDARLIEEERQRQREAELARLKASNDSVNRISEMKAMRDSMTSVSKLNALRDSMNHAADLRLIEQLRKDQKNETVFILEKGAKVILRGITFEFNKATIRPESEWVLQKARASMVANPDVSVIISGHTDNVGSNEYNQTLSLERAQAVKDWLVAKGIDSNRMKVAGKGELEPTATNETDDGRALNRRIEFFVE